MSGGRKVSQGTALVTNNKKDNDKQIANLNHCRKLNSSLKLPIDHMTLDKMKISEAQ